jgi:outer membrane immunogenic protein
MARETRNKGIGELYPCEIFLLTPSPRVIKTRAMKQITLTFAVLCAACALTFAGPEPIQSSGKEIVPQPVVETSCFAGAYFGIHGGVLLSNFNTDTTADEESLGADGNGFVSAFDRSSGGDGTAAQGGLHAGYNWQRGGWVFGVEVDLSATSLDENDTALAIVDLPNDFKPFSTTVQSKATVDWYSTLRPRFGHTLGDRVFIYGTGGLAFGMTELREITSVFSARDEAPSFDRNSGFDSERGVKFGWTAGAGIDFCLTHHVILNFTYLYTDLEDTDASTTLSFFGSGPPRTFDTRSTASSDNNFHVFQGGLSFKF